MTNKIRKNQKVEVSKNAGTQNGWFIRENPTKMDENWGVLPILETSKDDRALPGTAQNRRQPLVFHSLAASRRIQSQVHLQAAQQCTTAAS